MRRWVTSVTVTITALMLMGWGTIANTMGAKSLGREPCQVYGGVRADLASPCAQVLDLPCSLIGDTVTLPVTVPYSLYRLIAKPAEIPDGHDDSPPLEY